MGKINLKKKELRKKEKKEVKNGRRGADGKEESKEREREFFFSLLSKIYRNRTLGFRRSKRQVGPHIESYAWVPKSWSFVKLYEVRNFLT